MSSVSVSVFLLSVIVALSLSTAVLAQDKTPATWTQWRGPTRDGLVPRSELARFAF
jgi:hypothetical protein